MTLISFLQGGVDTVPLNRRLEFVFSSPVDPASVTPASIQVREGNQFGRTAQGTFEVAGTKVFFEPRLPGLCDLTDAGLRPGTAYRVVLVGHPEEFGIRSVSGKKLARTVTFEFETRIETDPDLFEDQRPGENPVAHVSDPDLTFPMDGAAALSVRPGGAPARIVIPISENLDPCTVHAGTVLFRQHELGDPNVAAGVLAPNGNLSGFDPPTDSDPHPLRWGASNSTPVSPAQTIPAKILLVQDFAETKIVIEPIFPEFPDNALLVVELGFGIQDFGGQAMVPATLSFTTENRSAQTGSMTLEFEGELERDIGLSTADLDTERAPSRVQGFMLFAGDGDNGANVLAASGPGLPPACTTPRQPNDGILDEFDPSSSVVLDTGATKNTCTNQTDGSTAVVFEYFSFRIRAGVTVRVIGVNPAIILVSTDAVVEPGGTLLVRGDGLGGAPQGRGGNGNWIQQQAFSDGALGGVGVAGGAGGGKSFKVTDNQNYGEAGVAGFGSPDAGLVGGHGSGRGGAATVNASFSQVADSQAGGGGGHATVGGTGDANVGGVTTLLAPADGAGGGVYPSGAGATRMPRPSAGSGGGGAGHSRQGQDTSLSFGGYHSTGGAGGAGGGFVDLTAGGAITVFGTIDAAGSRGGNGIAGSFSTGTGGGGGGSGGGIRLLTPNDINVTGGTLTAVGGGGGTGVLPTNSPAPVPPNHGGPGGSGRVVLEDGDSVITGYAGATVVPGEGQDGFFRGPFDAGRFQGGGLNPVLVTKPFVVGPIAANFLAPTEADFVAGIPSVASRGLNATGILVEAQGFPIRPDGTPDLTAPTGWRTVGFFRDSGVDSAPSWVAGQNPGDVAIPPGNVGAGFSGLNGSSHLQLRFSFFLPSGIGPFDPGPFIDRWALRFGYDQ